MANLTRWNQRNEMRSPRTVDDMFNEMQRNFWDMWDNRMSNDTARPPLRPAMDVVENEDNVTVRVDLPGMKPEDVNVEVEGDMLTISGEVGDEIEKEGEKYHYRERRYGSFRRSLRLNETLDTEHIDATFQNGVLNLVLPKRPETQPKRIKVEASK